MTTPQPVRGTQSLLGEEADRFHAVVEAFDRVRRLFGFKRVEVPIIEPTASSGSAVIAGMPPARETTSGRLTTENSARISEAVIPRTRWAYRSM